MVLLDSDSLPCFPWLTRNACAERRSKVTRSARNYPSSEAPPVGGRHLMSPLRGPGAPCPRNTASPAPAGRSNESRCQLPTVEGRRDTQKGDWRLHSLLLLSCQANWVAGWLTMFAGFVLNWQISFHTKLKWWQLLSAVHGRRAARKNNWNTCSWARATLNTQRWQQLRPNYGHKPPTERGFQDARTPTTPSTNSWHGQKHTRSEGKRGRWMHWEKRTAIIMKFPIRMKIVIAYSAEKLWS